MVGHTGDGAAVTAADRRPRCRQCERLLKPHYETREVRHVTTNLDGGEDVRTVYQRTGRILGYGYGRWDYFCSLRCGWRFAIDAIEGTEGTAGGSLKPPSRASLSDTSFVYPRKGKP